MHIPSEPTDPVRLVEADDCGGSTWWVSPTQRTAYYLSSLSPPEKAQAIMEAVQALTAHDSRPKLRLVHSVAS